MFCKNGTFCFAVYNIVKRFERLMKEARNGPDF